jgi:glycosyltransferase involved in cell wall biosynthesis
MSEASPGPKVSVVTPLYNSSAFIRRTLDSLLAQTYANWECLLVDDGSTDDTAEAVRPYLADPRFSYVRQENRGIAGARNTAIAAATGEWVCLLDHDDLWLPGKLEKQLRYALEHGCDILCADAFIVTGRERWLYGGGFPEAAAAVQRALSDGSVDVFGHLIKVNFVCASSVMLRRALFDEHGLLDQSVAPSDDYDMWLRCMPGARFGYLSEPLVEYVVHGGNYSKDMARIYEYSIRVLQRHRRRHAADARRRRQFDEALANFYGLFFRQLSQDRSRAHALRRTLSLLAGGPRVALLRRFARAAWSPLAARARNSAAYRWGLLRARVLGR